MAEQVRCACGRENVADAAWVRGAGGLCFVLCARCARQPEKRQYLATMFAQGRTFPRGAALGWLWHGRDGARVFDVGERETEALTRFRLAAPL